MIDIGTLRGYQFCTLRIFNHDGKMLFDDLMPVGCKDWMLSPEEEGFEGVLLGINPKDIPLSWRDQYTILPATKTEYRIADTSNGGSEFMEIPETEEPCIFIRDIAPDIAGLLANSLQLDHYFHFHSNLLAQIHVVSSSDQELAVLKDSLVETLIFSDILITLSDMKLQDDRHIGYYIQVIESLKSRCSEYIFGAFAQLAEHIKLYEPEIAISKSLIFLYIQKLKQYFPVFWQQYGAQVLFLFTDLTDDLVLKTEFLLILKKLKPIHWPYPAYWTINVNRIEQKFELEPSQFSHENITWISHNLKELRKT